MFKFLFIIIYSLTTSIILAQSLSIVPSPDISICYGSATELKVDITSSLYTKSFSFDGINDYIQIGDKPELRMTNAFTIEAWIFPTGRGSSNSYGGIIVNKEGEYEIARFPDGNIQIAISKSTTSWNWIKTGLYTPLNTWSHIVVCFGAGFIKTYLNGDLTSKISGPIQIIDCQPDNNDFRIGGREVGVQHFKGFIDELRVWNLVRSDLEVKNNYKLNIRPQNGLVGLWNPSHSSGFTIIDQANNYHGVLTNGALIDSSPSSPYLKYIWTPSSLLSKNDERICTVRPLINTVYTVTVTDIDGTTKSANIKVTVNKNPASLTISPSTSIILGEQTNITAALNSVACKNSVLLDGNDDYILVGEKDNLRMNSQLTIEAWLFPTGVGSDATHGGIIINKEGEYEIARFPNGTIQWAFKNTRPGWKFYNTGVIAPLNTWSHIAVSYNFGIVKTYLNGVLVNTFIGSGVIGDQVVDQNEFRIGGRQSISQNFKGMIDEVAIWNIVREEDDIIGDMKFGVSANPNLKGYWNFDEGQNSVAIDQSNSGNNGVLSLGASWSNSSAPPTPKITWSPALTLDQSEGSTVTATPETTTIYTASATDVDGSILTATVNVTVIRDVQNAIFTSQSSGNWNDHNTWKISMGNQQYNAETGEFPTFTNAVFLDSNYTISLSTDASCKDLNLNSTADVVRLNTGEKILDVHGKIRSYTGTPPGSSSSSSGVPNWIATGTNGRIRLKGNASRVVMEKDEFSDHENLKGWTLECDLAEGVVGTINSNFRAGNVIVTSGSLEVKSKSFRVSR